MSSEMGWLYVFTGNPYILMAIVPVISGVPGPIAMLRRRWRDSLDPVRRRRLVDYNLRPRNSRA